MRSDLRRRLAQLEKRMDDTSERIEVVFFVPVDARKDGQELYLDRASTHLDGREFHRMGNETLPEFEDRVSSAVREKGRIVLVTFHARECK